MRSTLNLVNSIVTRQGREVGDRNITSVKFNPSQGESCNYTRVETHKKKYSYTSNILHFQEFLK